MNLEQLRKQAKELVRAARAGDADALARLDGREPILARAQLVVAREHGYASWPALVAAVEASAETFVLAATNGQRTRAEALLAARPEIADDPWARLVLGRGWDGRPGRAGRPARLGAAPLRLPLVLRRRPRSRGSCSRAAPTRTRASRTSTARMSACTVPRASAHDPELTRVLLEAGADPDDGESVYHATEAESTECLRLLLEHGADRRGRTRSRMRSTHEALEHVRLLLEAGAADRRRRLPRPRRPARPRRRVPRRSSSSTGRSSTGRAGRPGAATCRCGRRTSTPCSAAGTRSPSTWPGSGRRPRSTDGRPCDRRASRAAAGRAGRFPAELDPDAQEVLILTALWRDLDARARPRRAGLRRRRRRVASGHARSTWRRTSARRRLVRTLLERGADANVVLGLRDAARVGGRGLALPRAAGTRPRRGRGAPRRRGEPRRAALPRHGRRAARRLARGAARRLIRPRSSRRARSRGGQAERAALRAPARRPSASLAAASSQRSRVARSSSRIWSVCARWPFVRSSHALSARPSTPKLSDGWRIQSIAEAIVRYWWMRRNVTGCESSAGPHGAVQAATRVVTVRDPRGRVVEQGAHLVVVQPGRAGRAHRHQQRVGLAAVRVVGGVDDLLGRHEAVEVEQVERAPDRRVEEHPRPPREVPGHRREVDDPRVGDDQRGRRMAVEKPAEGVGDRRQPSAAVDQDRDAPLGGQREDRLQPRVVGEEALRPGMELDPAGAEVDAAGRLLDRRLVEVEPDERERARRRASAA